MNEPRFTKGEWQHESDNVFHENGFHIARATMRQTVSECIANAALIAAAPELYEALAESLIGKYDEPQPAKDHE